MANIFMVLPKYAKVLSFQTANVFYLDKTEKKKVYNFMEGKLKISVKRT